MKLSKAIARILLAACVSGILPACATQSSDSEVQSAQTVPSLKKVMIVIFENTDYAPALAQPNFGRYARQGANLSNFFAETHPSQGNYIALTSGSLHNVRSDSNVDLDVRNIVDLLEEKGRSWKVYAENYPGNCFLGSSRGDYVRKHVPMLSYKNVQSNPARCAKIVEAGQLKVDVQNQQIPDFSLYIPNQKNDGHDTGVAFADSWFQQAFSPFLTNPNFSANVTLVLTFDESSMFGGNHIYTVLLGAGVRSGATSSKRYDHYSLLKTIELGLGLGNLGMNDVGAATIDDAWAM